MFLNLRKISTFCIGFSNIFTNINYIIGITIPNISTTYIINIGNALGPIELNFILCKDGLESERKQ